MMPTLHDLGPVLPEIFLLVMASLILILDLFVAQRNRFVTFAMTQLTLLVTAWITLVTMQPGVTFAFGGMFVDDRLADVLKLFTYLAVSVTLTYSRDYLESRGLYRGEYFVLALFAMLGIMVMISAGHFVVLYVGLELMTLCLYAMIALQRDSARASEAAMKYFVLGALASGLLLYGMSLIYGATGSLGINQVALAVVHFADHPMMLAMGLVFVVAGLAFKLGAVPFHMWVPDVYEGSPTAMTLFIGAAPKFAAFIFVYRMLVEALQFQSADWQQMLMVLAVLSMAVGNVTAIAQTNIKRMLAYSTIGHMGFMLLGFIAAEPNGYAAALFYIIVYVLTTLAGFGILMLLSRDGFEAENLDDLRGLNSRSPWYAFVMLLVMFSMAGIPPTVGFYAKLLVLQAVVDVGLVALAVIAVIFALIGAFYYLRVVRLMYFDKPVQDDAIIAQPDVRLLLSINGLALLVLGLLPQPLIELCLAVMEHSL